MVSLVERQAPRPTESPAMHRYKLSKRLGVLVDHVDYLDAAGGDVTSTKDEIRRVLAAMSAIDRLCSANAGE